MLSENDLIVSKLKELPIDEFLLTVDSYTYRLVNGLLVLKSRLKYRYLYSYNTEKCIYDTLAVAA